jgi:PQQ-like domain
VTRVRLAAALLAATALAVACTSGPGSESALPGGSGTPARDPRLPPAWTSTVDAVETPHAATGGFVLQALNAEKRFEMVSVDAADGRVRWRAPASPSRTDHGVGLHSTTVQDGRTVLWLAPGRVYRDGDVSLVAADTATGARRWSYGGGRLRLRSAPELCRDDRAVCLLANLAGAASPRSVVLDAASGRVLSDQPSPFTGGIRSISTDLYDAGEELAVVDDQGRLVWHRPATAIFGGVPVSPDYGWDLRRAGGRYVGSLGRVKESKKIDEIAATAGFDAATGRTLWTRPAASINCGQLQFDVAHPVVCDRTGTAQGDDGTKVSALDVTLEGIDPATGKARWKQHVGAVKSLYGDGTDLVRTGATTYTLRTADGLVTLDLDSGVRPGAADQEGWCVSNESATPAENVVGVNVGDPADYDVERWAPCRIDAAAPDRPIRTAEFAGATVAGVFAYTAGDGTLRAVRTG